MTRRAKYLLLSSMHGRMRSKISKTQLYTQEARNTLARFPWIRSLIAGAIGKMSVELNGFNREMRRLDVEISGYNNSTLESRIEEESEGTITIYAK